MRSDGPQEINKLAIATTKKKALFIYIKLPIYKNWTSIDWISHKPIQSVDKILRTTDYVIHDPARQSFSFYVIIKPVAQAIWVKIFGIHSTWRIGLKL